MSNYNIHALANGLRIIHRPTQGQVVYCGFGIAAGSRHELDGEQGLAHFCEHATFKGTGRRRAWHVLNCLESVGGDLNAFTNKEHTVYYAAVLKEHAARAIDLLADIVFNSTYPQRELDKEVGVVCDEIESYNDSPAELIFDEFENMLFKGHPLGHNILGQADQLRTYSAADVEHFARRHYRADNMVFFADGDLNFGRLVRLLEKATPPAPPVTPPASAPTAWTPPAPTTEERHLNTHQAHVMVGTQAFCADHPQRMALYLLNNMLGGPAMNSRLNLSLRERNGLVYTVESAMACYADTGLWGIYFGCDPHDVGRCLRLVRRELDRLAARPLSKRQLDAARKQLKGQMGVAFENREQLALDVGRSFLHNGWERDLTALYARLDAVTADDIHHVATTLFAPERLSTLIFR